MRCETTPSTGTSLLLSEKGNPRLRQVSKNSKKSKANNIATAKQENLANAPPLHGVSQRFCQTEPAWFKILYQSPAPRHSVKQAPIPSPAPADLQLEQRLKVRVR